MGGRLRLPDSLHAVIMAGGRGERFWPLSTPRRPKPFVEGLFERSLFRMTVDRLRHVLPMDRIWVILGADHVPIVREQANDLPPERLIVEPLARDTACAITLAAMVLAREVGPDTMMLVLPCDHWIHPVDGFWMTVYEAATVLDEFPDAEIVFGVRPNRPETAYGYIQPGSPLRTGVYAVRAFHEKPDTRTAVRYLEEGYFWNAGIFLWRVDRILALVERFLPETAAALHTAMTDFGTDRFAAALQQAYARVHPISIDYGVMEHADSIWMVEAAFAWDDVGQWEALDRILPKNEAGNIVCGNATLMNTRNTVVVNTSGWIGVMGVEDVVIIRDGDRVLVMRKGHGARLKHLVRMLPQEWKE